MYQFNEYAFKLFTLLQDCVPKYDGKVCVPISGGLDSRVIAWLVSRNQKIDLAYCVHQYRFKDRRAIGYAKRIANILGVKRFEQIIPPAKKGQHDTWVGNMMIRNLIDMSEYKIIIPMGLENMTGDLVNIKTIITGKYKKEEKRFWEVVRPECQKRLEEKGEINPLNNEPLMDFCKKLPLKYKIHQRLYRYMIKTYMPEVAYVPQEGTHDPAGIMGLFYLWYYYKRLIKKTLRMKL